MSFCQRTHGPWFNIKMPSYQYRKSHCGDKTVVRSSYLHNGISYTGKMSSLYWIGAQAIAKTNADWSPVMSCDVHMRTISPKMLKLSIHKYTWLKITGTSPRGQWDRPIGSGNYIVTGIPAMIYTNFSSDVGIFPVAYQSLHKHMLVYYQQYSIESFWTFYGNGLGFNYEISIQLNLNDSHFGETNRFRVI